MSSLAYINPPIDLTVTVAIANSVQYGDDGASELCGHDGSGRGVCLQPDPRDSAPTPMDFSSRQTRAPVEVGDGLDIGSRGERDEDILRRPGLTRRKSIGVGAESRGVWLQADAAARPVMATHNSDAPSSPVLHAVAIAR